jgi:ribosome-associated protein
MKIEENSEQETPEQVSKTQRKKDMIALQKLGEKLTTLKPAQLEKLPLDVKLRAAIDEFKRLPNSRGARKRQAQYIGRLMRNSDSQAINEAVENTQSNPAKPKIPIKEYELWCTRILQQGDAGITLLLEGHVGFERQKLRQFYLEYGKSSENKRPQVEKKLKTYLEQVLRI